MKILLNTDRTGAELLRAVERAQAAVVPVALADCNKFCKLKTGRLAASARGDLRSGLLIWDTPYARKAYYTGKPDRSRNPLASRLWAERAAKSFSGKWLAVIRKALFIR